MNETPYNAENALRSFGMDMQEAFPRAVKYSTGLSDMMGQDGFGNGGNTAPVGAGHSAEYWDSSEEKKSAESFADLTAAAVLGGPSRRYIQAVLPNTYDAYLAMLEDMAKR